MSEDKFCDISNHQPSTDAYIKAIKDWGAKAVVVKITEGSFFIDNTASAKIALIKKYGMKVHAYHFFHGQSESDAKDEARYFCKQADALGLDKNTTIMVNDIEASDLTTNASTLTKYANAFYDEVASQGWKRQDTYSSASWFQGRLIQSQLKANNFWCASFGAKPSLNFPTVKYNAWQYSADATYGSAEYIGGIVTDCNVEYNGYYTADVGSSEPDPTTEETTPDLPSSEEAEDINELFKKILADDSLKYSTIQYCYSILGYLSTSQIYDKPIFI